MRLKKGFTLAEILIVLMVIGVVATMTIPSLMRGVQDAQFKTAYKKAFNAVVNIAAMENVSGNLPASQAKAGVAVMYKTLKTNLSVKDFVAFDKSTLTAGTKVDLTDVYSSDSESGSGIAIDSTSSTSPWLTTEDNISYTVMTVSEYKKYINSGSSEDDSTSASGSGTSSDVTSPCGSKLEINADGVDKACVVVVVDVNGVTSNPNTLDSQVVKGIQASEQLTALEGDRFPIFIGKDGATAGSKKTTVTGRMAAELK